MEITEQERRTLLGLARETVAAAVSGSAPPKAPPGAGGTLARKLGCFVTLTRQDHLRGCIGTFHPQLPLAAQIIEMGLAAAQDSRFVFDPITPEEVGRLTVGVSVLSELTPIANPLDIELGVHGIYVSRGYQAACFLPEVATETGWTKEQFLSHCCEKGGMPPDTWREAKTKVLIFTSEKFAQEPA